MKHIPYDPLNNLLYLQERMNRLFDDTMKRSPESESFTSGAWAPAVDIFETDDDIVLMADIPGLSQDEVDIQVRDNMLTISGDRKQGDPIGQESYVRVERPCGVFSRSFTLPSTVDQENISASYAKGVLAVRMPKSRQAAPQQIKVELKD